MLSPLEKAYCLALQALKCKDYQSAETYFDQAASAFEDDREFTLLRETTELLLAVQRQLGRHTEAGDRLEIEETFTNG